MRLAKAFPEFNKVADRFRWRTMEGRTLTIDQMKTSHIFNSMKMIFNHIAEQYGGEPIWFTKKYPDYELRAKTDPKRLAKRVVLFCWVIEQRGDLQENHREPYRLIVNQILGIKSLREAAKSEALPPPRRSEAVTAFLGPTLGDALDSHFHGENGIDLDPPDDY